MEFNVWRAENLLAELKHLDPRQSTYEEAMRLAHKYSSHVQYLGESRSPKNCRLGILLGRGWGERRPLLARIERAVGIRVSNFYGVVELRDNRVVGKSFDVWTKPRSRASVGQWLTVGAGLADNFAQVDFREGLAVGLETHSNHFVRVTPTTRGHLMIAGVTPDATAPEIERTFDFRLSCASSLAGCADVGEILPAAWEDHLASEISSPPAEYYSAYDSCPVRSVARLARDMENAVVVEVQNVFPLQSEQHRSQEVAFKLLETLKGQPDKLLSRYPLDIGGNEQKSASPPIGLPSRLFPPGRRFVMFLKDSQSYLDFTPNPICEVVPATAENVGAVRKTVTQLAAGTPITALKQGDL